MINACFKQCYSPTSTSCKYAEIQWGCRPHLHALLVMVVSPSKLLFPPITARAFMRPYKLKGTHDTYLHALHLPQSSFRTHPIHFPHFLDCFGIGTAVAYSSFWHSRYLYQKRFKSTPIPTTFNCTYRQGWCFFPGPPCSTLSLYEAHNKYSTSKALTQFTTIFSMINC